MNNGCIIAAASTCWHNSEGARSAVRGRKRIACWLFVAALGLAITSTTLAQSIGRRSLTFNGIPPAYRLYAVAAGQRLYLPGKECISAEGVLLMGDGREHLVELVWQNPFKLKMSIGESAMFFDANAPAALPQDDNLGAVVQTLLEDTLEGLFAQQTSGRDIRYLGSGFRLKDAEGVSTGIDIFQVTMPGRFHNKIPVVKSYWFDSSTKLLGVVTYKSGDHVIRVIVDDWRNVQGERIPFRIERWKDHERTMILTLSSATISASMNDSAVGGN